MDQLGFGDQLPSQQQRLGDIQIQGDSNVFNTIQGRDIQIVNLTVYDDIPEAIEKFSIHAVKPLTRKDFNFRKVLLNKVKKYWVQDVLEKSLHARVLIELGLEERLDAVKDPFNSLQTIPEASRRSNLNSHSVSEVFHQMGEGRTLLILGKPGAGKTITLLRLAKDLIARVEPDLSQPIPVVLNLSSWAVKQKPIAVWLVEELSSKYQVSKALGKTWVADQQLLLLLDGLDEVKADRREACIHALNQFTQAYGQTEMVVCSRDQDYEALSTRLQLQGAIYIRPLTLEQVHAYLDKAGDQLQAVKLLLQDTGLQELATSPLILSIMSLAYRNSSAADLPQTGSLNKQHLFDAYIKQMLGRRRELNEQYSKEEIIRWLVILAQKMVQDSQTMILIERLQPSFLRNRPQLLMYQVGAVLVSGVLGSLAGGIAGGIAGGLRGLDSGLIWVLSDGLRWGSIGALSGGLISALVVGLGRRQIEPVETFKLSWILFSQSLTSRYTLTRGLIGAFIGAAIGLLSSALTWGPSLGLMFGSSWGLMFGSSWALIKGLKGAEIETKTIPNQAIWRSALNALFFGLFFGVMGALVGGLNFAIMSQLMDEQHFGLENSAVLIGAISGGLTLGLLGVLINEAGRACLRHFTLRLVLYSHGLIPWNCSRFLDYAVQCIFLQKVGGGYIFIHRMLLEHFSQIELERN